MSDRLDDLGHMVSEVTVSEMESAEQLDLTIRRVRYRLEDSIDRGQTARAPTTLRFWGAGVALVAVAILSFISWPGAEKGPLRVYAESDSVELTGATVGSSEGTKQLRFTDGTRLSLYPKTVVRVVETSNEGATVRLEGGRTLASIVPEQDAKWRLLAGPYVVRVTGTEFDLAWHPGEERMELAMHRGSVLVSGPGIAGQRVVQGSEFVQFRVKESEGNDEAASESASPTRPEETKSLAQPVDDEGAQTDGQPSRPVVEDKKRTTTSRSAEQLWKMVQQHRKTGEGQAAKDALLELRSRHGARGQTAYLLGRVHADLLGSSSEAGHWFEMYLKEAPGGLLSEQALGRLIELQRGTAAGIAVAERYLRQYPNGAYSGLARSLLR